VKFEYDNKFGFFTACPRFIGTGMHMEVKLKLDKMSKEEINAWIEGKGFKWRYVQGKDKQVLMENKATIGKTETEMLCNLLFYVRDVLEENRKG
jgi:protein-arginine kinase